MSAAGDIEHGTYSTYCNHHCRCDDCRRAASKAHHRQTSAVDCAGFHAGGSSFPCQRIEAALISTGAEVARIARMASKSAAQFARHAEALETAKAHRDAARKRRDAHMSECPTAYERWSA